jgi:heavy metal sensor kinase
MMRLPIKVRLAAWYVTVLALILGILGSFLLLRLRSDLVAGIDHSLETRASQIGTNYGGGGEGEFRGASEGSLVNVPRGETADQILSPSGQVLQAAGDAAIADMPMLTRAQLSGVLPHGSELLTANLGRDHEPFRVLAVRIRHSRRVLVVTESLEEVNGSIHRLLALMLVAGPAALAAAGLGGWWIASKALRPVRVMTEAASSIGVDRLHERVAVPPGTDEIGTLGRTLNAMLDRLQQGVADKQRFIADASHELRTPLAVMRSEIDVSLRSRSVTQEAREVLESAAEEVERMTGIVENLLTLARIDEGKLDLLRSPVALSDVANAVAMKLGGLAQAKGISLDVAGDGAVVRGDRPRLYQAVANLVDNAVKYTPAGGEVRVSIWRKDQQAGLTVRDSGPGIPAEALPRIFERFVRADAARSRGGGGSGLGLAIVREIVEAHGGTVWVESDPGHGSAFSLELPVLEE